MLKYILLLLVLVIAILLAARLVRMIYLRRYVFGASESQKFYYHGSDNIIDELEPRPAGVIDNEKAVFATSSYVDAVIFSAIWSDYNFSMGTHDGIKYLDEMYPGAFEKLDTTGYIHYVPADKFHRDSRTGLSSEFISFEPVKTIKYDKVNVKEYLEKSDVQMTTYEERMQKLHDNSRIPLIPREQLHKIKVIYIPIDFYWNPHIDGNVIFFDRMSPEELNNELLKYDEPNSVILVGDIVAAPDVLYDFSGIKTIVLEPQEIKYFGSRKTTEEEYMKFIEARRELLKDYEVEKK